MERRTGAKSRAQLRCSVVVEGRKEWGAEREGICALYVAATVRMEGCFWCCSCWRRRRSQFIGHWEGGESYADGDASNELEFEAGGDQIKYRSVTYVGSLYCRVGWGLCHSSSYQCRCC